ncbi:ankyrin repeat domain-containing protein SOWAHB [Tyto alba]|uniref:ankyrin repeat domain-containing protein SOWAHB n=1 Tax=Tyto alba TaxID=56313 RepID=UPI001C6851D3|nr:ankyrin repeat domain-containing protein SOWAHB [Tyto alba]
MARELSQEAVLDFLWGAGGRAPNTALLRHFQRFLRDPALTEQQRRERREYFKSLVNALATVHPAASPGASKDIVLRRRYRDLLDEELPPPEDQQEQEEEKNDPPLPPPRRDPDWRRGPRGEAAEKGRGSRSPPPPAAQPPPYRTRPLSSGPWALHPAGQPRSRLPVLPSGRTALTPAEPPPYQSPPPLSASPSQPRSPPLPPTGAAPLGSLPPQRPRGPPLTQSRPLPPGPGVLPPPCSPPHPRRGMPRPPSASPGGQPCTRPTHPPLLSSGTKGLSPTQPPRSEPPPSRSLLLLSTPGGLPLSRSLQTLPAGPSASPPLLSGPGVLPFTRLSPAQSRSLQQLPTRPSPSPPREYRVLAPNGPTQPQALLPCRNQTLLLPSGPGVLPPTRPPPSQSPPQSPPARPAPSQSLLPARGPTKAPAPESSPPAPLPVFRSIRCQLALLEAQGIPPSLPDDGGRQPRTLSCKSSPRNAPSRGLVVPLGQREHSWLVAVSAGRWARVRGLFLEEPELALQRDFMSGFTVLHWLAKHGDGPGLQELAAAARQAGLALDVDARSGCGYTPLHLAAIHGHQLVIKVLVLQLGCQVQVRDSSGRRPWEYLGSSTSGEIWQLLEAPRGTIMFPTQPLARSMSSVSKVSLSAGRAALPACLRPWHGRGAASHRTGSESD